MPDDWIDRRDALPQGCVLRDYTIQEVLGHGGFGIVYKARHNELDHVVAIKEYLPSELAVREGTTISVRSGECETHFADGLRRFREEAKALIEFQRHPSIVDCHEFFRANGTAYLVIEYVDGLPLSELLREREAAGQPFTESDLLAIGVPLAEGLAHIHRAGVIHRDIKPSNILIRRADHGPVLIDFGAAKQVVAEHSRSLAPYTEGYAALEQVADGQLGPWTDLYGFGAVLWRMVAGGNRPWEPPNPVKVESRANARVREVDDPLPTAKELGAGRFAERLLEMIDGCLQLRDTERIRETNRVVLLLSAGSGENRQAATAEQQTNARADVDKQLFEESEQPADPADALGDADTPPSSFGKRLAGALLCSRRAYTEIAADRSATWHAVAIVLVTSILSALFGDAGLWTSSTGEPTRGSRIFSVVYAPMLGLAGTAVHASIIRMVAEWFGRRSLAFGGWFRVMGFIAPAGELAVIPSYGWIAVQVYSLILDVVATKAVAATTTRRAIIIVLVAVVGESLIMTALMLLYLSIGAMTGLIDNPFG